MAKGISKQAYRWDQTGAADPNLTVLKTSDELDWSDVNVALLNGEPRGFVHQQALPDLRLVMQLNKMDVTVAIDGREHHLIGPIGLPSIIAPETAWSAKWRDNIHALSIFVRRSILAEVGNELFEHDIKSLGLCTQFAIEDRSITWLIQLLMDALNEPKGYANLKVEYIARALVADVLRKHSVTPLECPILQGQLSSKQVNRVIDYIQEHLSSKIMLGDIAKQAGLGQTVFLRRFNASFGMSPHRYVIEARIGLARKLLEEAKLPIIEIAAQCGFADQAHFTAMFKRKVGMPPSRYRQLA